VPVARHRRQPHEQQYRNRVNGRDDELEQREGDRAQRRIYSPCRSRQSSASSAEAANARSGKITVFRGNPPSRSVFSPLPVSTSIGCAPTVSAACKSRSPSPTQGTPAIA